MTLYTKSLVALTTLFAFGCTDSTEVNKAQSDTQQKVAEINESTQGVEDELFKNDYAQVLQITLEPGQQLPWHKGEPRAVLALSDFTARFKKHPDDVTTSQNDIQQGDVHWHAENTHQVENTGDTDASFVVIERLNKNLPKSDQLSTQSDVANTKTSGIEVLLNNDWVKVTNVTLESGNQIPAHTGTPRVIYSLSDYSLSFTSDGQTDERSFEKGDTHWHDGGKHTIENIGDTTATFVVTEFKQ